MKLPNDICRCFGKHCGEKETCERWIQRETGGERTPYTLTMIQEGQGECGYKIEVIGDEDGR